jgi:putative ABC transport system permease protein
MIRVVLKGLAGRKLRTGLTAMAIVLGVAMVSGAYVFTDRIDKAIDALFTGAYRGSDAVISGNDIVESSTSGDATVPADLVATVAAFPEVETASGGIVDVARLLDQHGTPISTRGSAVGVSVDASVSASRFNPLALTAGRWPSRSTEIAIDGGTADNHGFDVGDTIGVTARGPVRQFTITGIAEFVGLRSTGEVTLAIFDLPTAQDVFDKPGQLDEILVAAVDGVTQEALVEQLQSIVPAGAEVVTGPAQVKAEASHTDKQVALIQKVLLAFGGIAVFVGAFVIFNTFSITIAQRTRELATLRTLGASRRQVLASVVVESVLIGLLASVAGLFVGLVLAKALAALSVAAGTDLPDGGAVLATRTVVVSLLVGVVITLIAGLAPALRATRIPPVAAVREGATLPKSSLARYIPRIAAAAIGLGSGAISVGLFLGGLSLTTVLVLLAFGGLLLFVGVAMISTALVTPIASVLGWPTQRLAGTAGRLARENVTRNPARTAATAAALMIYLALVTFVAVLGHGMRTSVTNGVDRVVRADFVVTADDGISSLPPAVGEAIAELPEVVTVSSVRQDSALAFGSDLSVNGLDPATVDKVLRLAWHSGSAANLAGLTDDGAIVRRDFAADHDLHAGSRFGIETAQGRTLELTVEGVYASSGLDPILGPISISREAFDTSFERPQDAYTFVRADGGTSDANAGAFEAALDVFPEADLLTTSEFRQSRAKEITTNLQMVYGLLALSVVVSLLGMINTLVLSVFERTRELGLLRAVGMTRRQARRMIRQESIMTALVGVTLGLPIGLLLAALVTRALSDTGVDFAVPGLTLALFVVTAIIAGVLAAILPARRASRLDVLEALQYQ